MHDCKSVLTVKVKGNIIKNGETLMINLSLNERGIFYAGRINEFLHGGDVSKRLRHVYSDVYCRKK